MNDRTKSKLALWLSGTYLLVALASWLLPLIAKPGDSMAGIFLMVFAQPWASLWLWVTDMSGLDSMTLTMVVMLAAILLNAWIIYRVINWLSNR